ncbi:MAG TPA: NAD(P)/FAD-dependent oxidoreductase [Gammaproteobacteria bacterium]
MQDSLDVVVIGAGVIGLAVARELAQAGREVVVLERNERIGEETSSRNSEVIHAGIYYPTGSLKARLCVRGKELLYRYCEAKDVPHRRCGKIIVALDEPQTRKLEALREQATINGVNDLTPLSSSDVAALEPEVRCAAALMSPSTGIVDSHSLMLALRGDLEAAGGSVAVVSEFRRGEVRDGLMRLSVATDDDEIEISANAVVNAAGLASSQVARAISGLDPELVPETHYAKGTYYVLNGKSPFSHLIYPMPDGAWLGVHVTLDMAGSTRFGPNQRWIDEIDYQPDADQAEVFAASIERYWPGVSADLLSPGYAGVRPKIVAEGEPPGDFVIQGCSDHGIAGLVNLFGIESPGLTSSLAIGEEVAGMLAG